MMKNRILVSLVAALGLASAANAISVVVDTDKKTYLTGDSITVTTTMVVTGAEGRSRRPCCSCSGMIPRSRVPPVRRYPVGR